MFDRASGVLLHITSLPSPYGIGTMGQAAYSFVDFLRQAGQRYWQVLPLGHIGFGESPYQCFSAAAGNPLLLDLDLLQRDGLLTAEELRSAQSDASPDRVNFERLRQTRPALFQAAAKRARDLFPNEIAAFRAENADWLEDYALFMALHDYFDGKALWDWPDAAVQAREPAALATYRALLADSVWYYIFLQYTFFTQWHALRQYAAEQGVQIIGDLPMYVSADSVDVWQHPQLFCLNADFSPSKVAGVPPDYYSETGQLWGNPVYDWTAHEKNNFRWWRWRMKRTAELFDVVRMDHFRGLESYWQVSCTAEDARTGEWKKGPGMKLFGAIRQELGALPIIAEDLGIITDEVRALLQETGFPGMRVMIFGFLAEEDNLHLPHNYPQNTVVYTSTHDSQSICEQILDICTPADGTFARDYIRYNGHGPMAWCAIWSLFSSPASLAITTMQDLLNLGADARMNIPATVGGNWRWRVRREGLNDEVAAFLRQVTITTKRFCLPKPNETES